MLEQHPVGQLRASHTHWPSEHRWPVEQAGALPHWHWPLDEQLSPVRLQSRQAWPLPPQLMVVRWVQVEPTQQPVSQLAAHPLQTPR